MCNHNTFSYLWFDKKLQAIDQCISLFILQLNLAGIKTIESCCGHGGGYPNVLCEKGTEEKLRRLGCKIVMTRKDELVLAYFPVNSFTGKVYPVKKEENK